MRHRFSVTRAVWVLIGILVLVYLASRAMGFDRQITLEIGDAAFAGIILVALVVCAAMGRALLIEAIGEEPATAGARMRQKYPGSWRFRIIGVAAIVGAVAALFLGEFGRMLVPRFGGAPSTAPGVVVQAGNAHDIYGRYHLFDQCLMYADISVAGLPSRRVCTQSSNRSFLPLADEKLAGGQPVQITLRGNVVGVYVERIDAR